jgi:hypothetical protein
MLMPSSNRGNSEPGEGIFDLCVGLNSFRDDMIRRQRSAAHERARMASSGAPQGVSEGYGPSRHRVNGISYSSPLSGGLYARLESSEVLRVQGDLRHFVKGWLD